MWLLKKNKLIAAGFMPGSQAKQARLYTMNNSDNNNNDYEDKTNGNSANQK